MATDARAAARRWRSHGMGVAVATAAGSDAAASRTAALASGQTSSGLRTCGLRRKGLLHQIREDPAWSCFHEIGHAARFEGAHDVEPADRMRERLDEPLADVVERLRGHAGVDRHARLAELDRLDSRPEGLD